jgi:membrane protease subunit HflC
MNKKIYVLLVALSVSGFLVYKSLYRVNGDELVLTLRLGQFQSETRPEAGIYFAIPFLQEVIRFDLKPRSLVVPVEPVLSLDKKVLSPTLVIQWRVANGLRYFQALGRDSRKAEYILGSVVSKYLQEELGRHDGQALLNDGYAKQFVLAATFLAKIEKEFGIEIVASSIEISRHDQA